jgi:predicted DCC family thiol-disulfide oxidoreductase YuxK
MRWIKKKQKERLSKGRSQIVYDGNCHFCTWSLQKLFIMDLFGRLEKVNYHTYEDIKKLHPVLDRKECHSQLHLIEPNGKIFSGFFVFRRLCLKLPMLYPLIPIVYFPGSGIAGPSVYRWVAQNRYLLHFNKQCKDNTCFR